MTRNSAREFENPEMRASLGALFHPLAFIIGVSVSPRREISRQNACALGADRLVQLNLVTVRVLNESDDSGAAFHGPRLTHELHAL